jgi:hypothetical protein
MTAKELAERAKRDKPHVRYAYNDKGNGVAAWSDKPNRWVMVAGLTIFDTWASLEHELLINGKPMHEQNEWNEVTA